MPYRMIYQVFKALALSMILIFVFDIVFYLYRVYSLNQRMESLMVSVQKVVSENNYLPSAQYNMYNKLFNDMAVSFNGTSGDVYSQFIKVNGGQAVSLNYSSPASGTPTISGVTVRNKLDTPSSYGDVFFIKASVEVYQPMWDFIGGLSAINWQNDRMNASLRQTTTLNYTYIVPCLKYQSVTG